MRYIRFIIFPCFLLIANLAIGASQTERDSLLSVLHKAIPDSVRINTLFQLSSSNITEDTDQCLFWLQEALLLAQKNKLNEKEAQINQYIGLVYVDCLDSLKAFRYLNLADTYYKFNGTINEQLESLNSLGNACKSFNLHKKGICYCKEALELAETKESKARFFNQIGLSFIHLGNYESALVNLLKAEGLIENTNNLLSLAQVKTNLGVIYLRLKYFDKALSYFTHSSELKRELGDKKGLAISYSNIGSILHFQGKSEESIDILNKALLLAKELGLEYIITPILGNIGSILNDKKDYPKAMTYFKEALKRKEARNNPQLFSNLGKAYYNSGQPSLALDYYMQGFEIAKKNNQLEFVKTISEQLSSYYRDRNDYRRALEFQDIFLEAKDSLLNEQIVARISDIQNKHESEKQSNKIQVLEKNNELKELRLLLGKKMITSLIIGSVLFLLIIFLVIQKNKYIKKSSSVMLTQQKKIYLQEKKLLEIKQNEIQQELRDKNNELASHIMHVTEKNEFIARVTKKLLELKKYAKNGNQKYLDNIISELRINTKEDIWNEFDMRFNEIQKEYLSQLNARFPHLTTAERRLCAFLHMNMTSKEISQITYQTPRGIDTARSRLRKKLGITDPNTNLTTFLLNL